MQITLKNQVRTLSCADVIRLSQMAGFRAAVLHFWEVAVESNVVPDVRVIEFGRGR